MRVTSAPSAVRSASTTWLMPRSGTLPAARARNVRPASVSRAATSPRSRPPSNRTFRTLPARSRALRPRPASAPPVPTPGWSRKTGLPSYSGAAARSTASG